MTPEQAAKLREPFPDAVIGKLPKGGIMLDYVGHAAVTDRLLQVDPGWTWEPLALTADGLPAADHRGNLWIKLTCAGVTRIGVGDGKNAKECISDAIRNAAMRFGVALDLWAKEDLQALRNGKPVETPIVEDDGLFPPPDVPQGITEAQEKKLNLLVGTLRTAGHITTEQLWRRVRPGQEWPRDMDGELHWAPLRDSLSKDEASALTSRLEKLQQRVSAPDFAARAAEAQAKRTANEILERIEPELEDVEVVDAQGNSIPF